MKKTLIAGLAVCLAVCVLAGVMYYFWGSPVDLDAVVDWDTMYTCADVTEADTRIGVQKINGADHMILPATVSPEAVPLEPL